MSEKALKIVPAAGSQDDAGRNAPQAEASRRRRAPGRKRLRMILLVGAAGARVLIGGGVFYLIGRPLHLDRQRLCRRAEGADHAGHFRQGHRMSPCARASTSMPATNCSRSTASPSSSRSTQAQGQARRRAQRLRQAENQSRIARHAGRPGAEERRAQAARRRPQDQAGAVAGRLAGRRRHRRQPGW